MLQLEAQILLARRSRITEQLSTSGQSAMINGMNSLAGGWIPGVMDDHYREDALVLMGQITHRVRPASISL